MVPTPTVLFVCTGNYYRSRFAEAYFNARAANAGIAWRGESRGLALEWGATNPGPMAASAVAELARLGIHLPPPLRPPSALTLADLARAGLVIAVNEIEHNRLLAARYPGWEDRVAYWHVPDVDMLAPDVALADLAQRVERLLQSLQVDDHNTPSSIPCASNDPPSES